MKQLHLARVCLGIMNTDWI